jgi:hypothetical protein
MERGTYISLLKFWANVKKIPFIVIHLCCRRMCGTRVRVEMSSGRSRRGGGGGGGGRRGSAPTRYSRYNLYIMIISKFLKFYTLEHVLCINLTY